MDKLTQPVGDGYVLWQLAAIGGLLDALDQGGRAIDNFPGTADAIGRVMHFARGIVAVDRVPEELRAAAVKLLGRIPADRNADLELLFGLIVPQTSGVVQNGAIEAIGRHSQEALATRLLDKWRRLWANPAIANIGRVLRSTEVDTGSCRRTRRIRPCSPATSTRRIASGCCGRRTRPSARSFSGYWPARSILIGRKSWSNPGAVPNLPGDAEHGATVFVKHCTGCHQLRGVGHVVGPDLASLTDHTPSSCSLRSSILIGPSKPNSSNTWPQPTTAWSSAAS